MPIKFDGHDFTTLDGNALSTADAIKWSDYARAHKIANELESDQVSANVIRTIQLLEKAAALLECDFIITSFYRCPVLNVAVGGRVNPPSAHMNGRAADCVPDGKDIQKCFDILKANADLLNYDQLIIERNKRGNIWLHLAVARVNVVPRKMAFSMQKEEAKRETPG